MPFAQFRARWSVRVNACSCSGLARSGSSARCSPVRMACCRGHATGRQPRSLGFESSWTQDSLPHLPFDAVIDASNAPALPALAVDLVEPGKRVVFVGLAGSPSLVDTRRLALKDVTAVGVLSASPGIADTIERFASGAVDPRPLVSATVGLDGVAAVLAGERPAGAGLGPKTLVDPRI